MRWWALITYGTMAQVHELGYTECAKSYVFRGNKDYQGQAGAGDAGLWHRQLVARPGMQQMAPQPGRPAAQPMGGAQARFLLPVQQCEFQLTNVLESLQKDPWPVCQRQA